MQKTTVYPVYLFATVLATLAASPAMALTDLERMQQVEAARTQNLEVCRSGRSPETCKKHLLRPGEVKEAEKRNAGKMRGIAWAGAASQNARRTSCPHRNEKTCSKQKKLQTWKPA